MDTEQQGAAFLTPLELLNACEELVRTFNPARTTVDAHTADYVAQRRVGQPDDQRFLQQVMYGCTRYKKLLRVFISSLYFKHSGETQRTDQTLYSVLGYLALVRLTELGFGDFRQLLLSQEHLKMSIFLRFLFDEENLKSWLRPEWIKLYEPTFVDDQIIDKALVFVPQVEALQQVLEGRMASEAAKKEAAAEAARALAEGRGGSGQFTTPEPFALTQPKPRRVPFPEDLVEANFVAKPVPASTFADPKHLKDRLELDKKKDANRVEMKAKYADPTVQPFKLRVSDRPSHLQRIREEVEAARQAECAFEGPKANPVPKQRPGGGNVRLNAASILREDNLYRKKQEDEAKLLGAYEQELRDSSEFDAWQRKMRALDEDARQREIERRRMETLLADEEAKEARLRTWNEKRALAAAAKLEANANSTKRQQEEEQLQVHQRALVLDVQSQREKPAQATEELVRKNHAKAQDLRDEMGLREAQAAEARRLEDERRADLIKQIRALELVPRQRTRVLDPTYTPQLGLLEEMSLAELRERMQMLEVERQREEEEKRTKIVSAKQERENDLAQRAERLTAMRELAAQQASARRDLSRQQEAQLRRAEQERLAETQLEVHTKIEEKRAARRKQEAKLASDLKAIRIKNSFLGTDREAVERKGYESQQAGAAREIRVRQTGRGTEASAKMALDHKERAQRLHNIQRERAAHEAFLRDYEATCASSHSEAAESAAALKATREFTHGSILAMHEHWGTRGDTALRDMPMQEG